MSKEEKHAPGTRLWSTEAPRGRERQPEEKVISLPTAGAPPSRDYAAFEVKPNVVRLHIQAATQPSRFPSYNYLLDVIYDHDFQSMFTLIFSFMAVEVKGQNLGDVVHAITAGSCAIIREHHKKSYDPVTKGQAVIEAIKITTPNDRDDNL